MGWRKTFGSKAAATKFARAEAKRTGQVVYVECGVAGAHPSRGGTGFWVTDLPYGAKHGWRVTPSGEVRSLYGAAAERRERETS
jgi:23S rRNA G2445 N2-methylase RlmL